MKVVILAGGLGSRLSEETSLRPKPMVEIGGKPILWHIMGLYARHGLTDFVVCLGYKGYVVKEYFQNYFLHTSDVVFDFNGTTSSMEILRSDIEPWRVTLVDTGPETETGGRIKRVLDHVGESTFCMTYGDGLADVDLTALIAAHRRAATLATVTAVQPPGRFGALELDGDAVTGFQEKPRGDHLWINGGFFVLEPEIGRYIAGDSVKWEEEPMRSLAVDGQLNAFRHDGFWRPMDTLRDRNDLDAMCQSGTPPWLS